MLLWNWGFHQIQLSGQYFDTRVNCKFGSLDLGLGPRPVSETYYSNSWGRSYLPHKFIFACTKKEIILLETQRIDE